MSQKVLPQRPFGFRLSILRGVSRGKESYLIRLWLGLTITLTLSLKLNAKCKGSRLGFMLTLTGYGYGSTLYSHIQLRLWLHG